MAAAQLAKISGLWEHRVGNTASPLSFPRKVHVGRDTGAGS